MWGMVLSALTIAVSFLTESGREDRQQSRAASSSSNAGGGAGGSSAASRGGEGWLSSRVRGSDHSPLALTSRLINDRAFLSGALLGLGISMFWATLSNEIKLGERCRQLARAWLYWEKEDEAPLRRPVSLLHDEAAALGKSISGLRADGSSTAALPPTRFLQRDNHGSVREILSCRTSSTRNLHGVTVTIRPGREMSPARSRGVELYYVLGGNGVVSQQGIAETSPIRAGDVFVVDLGRMRWIANPDAIAEDLVLLRVSDGGGPSATGCFCFGDVVRLDPNRRIATTTYEAIKDGVRQAHDMARDYVNGVTE